MARALGPESLNDRESCALPRPGTVLDGRFELLELVGCGGMGAVYRARDREAQRELALKLLTVEEETTLRRFRREYRAASQLDHPNVVGVLSYHGLSRPYFTMEFVPGATLGRWVGATDAPALNHPSRLLRIRAALSQLLDALEYIHGRDLVHRDLKPDNILVTADGRLKIMDFGLVHGAASSSGITQGRVVGTLAYMAPEQLEGLPVDARTDLYALGAILYELLTGEPPFEEGEFGSLARAILQHDPPSPRSLNPGVDPLLANFAMTLLRKKPWQRFASAGDARAVLEARSVETDRAPRRPLLLVPQFVGRDHELGVARESLDAIAGDGLRVLLFSGTAGLGKTRLLEEIGAQARQRGLKVLGIDGRAGLREPRAPFLRLLEALRATIATRGRVDLDRLEELLRAPAEGPEHGDRKEELVRGLSRAIDRAGGSGGAVVLIDDLESFDGASLALLAALVREMAAPAMPDAPAAQALVVATYDEGMEEHSAGLGALRDRVARQRLGETIALRPFAREESEAAIRSMLGETAVPPALVSWLHQESEGIPAFLEQTLCHLVQEGYLVREAGRTTLDWERVGRPERDELEVVDFGNIPLAGAVKSLVDRQLSRLDAETREVLVTAAVVGREFDFDTLLGAVGTDEDRLIGLLERLIAGRHVRELHDRRDAYCFTHERARDVLLVEVDGEELRERHRRVAEAIERGPAFLRDAVALARHWDAAGESERARHYMPAAAERLALCFDHAAAVEAWARYLELGPGDAASEKHAQRMLGRELGMVRRLPEAKAVLEVVYAETQDAEQRIEILRELSSLEGRLGSFGAAIARACELLQVCRELGDRPRQARALCTLGGAQIQHGHLADAEQSLREAEELFRELDDQQGLASALRARGSAVGGLGRLGEAAHLIQMALAHFRACKATREEQAAIFELATVHLNQGNLGRAIECSSAARDMACAFGNPERVALAHANLGYALILAGDHADAERCLALALRYATDGRHPAIEAVTRGNRAILLRLSGDPAEALGELRLAREVMGDTVPAGLLAEMEVEAGRIHARSGHLATARRILRRALRMARERRLRWLEALAEIELSAVLCQRAALKHATSGLELAESIGADLLAAQALWRIAEVEIGLGRERHGRRARDGAARILRAIGRDLGPRERLFLRTQLCRAVLGAAECPARHSSPAV